ncbi:MAG: capsular polysaccharide biosynthesis protein, partial [Paracoccaceae bacterium]
ASREMHARARAALALWSELGLSKYNAFDPDLPLPEPGYVLVIDQTRDDASIRHGAAKAETFARMLDAARHENPGARILIKTHPETALGFRKGHYEKSDEDTRVSLFADPVSPQELIRGASAVYCATSLMGFEAILAQKRPRVFGRPFYGGWGLSDDEQTFKRRTRTLSREALFAGAMLIYPVWYDPCRDRLCDFETAAISLAARARAWQQDSPGYAALGMRLWKRRPLRLFFRGAGARLSFHNDPARAAASGRRGLVWAGQESDAVKREFSRTGCPLLRLEDGFLRSRGLGAELVPALSLVVDDLGIYYDPNRESRLERMLNASDDLSDAALARARRLCQHITESGLSKYNIGAGSPLDWPRGRRKILVPGQVEDDQSILKGAGDIRRNLDLLACARRENPDAFIAYKPHPDVEAGLRKGAIAGTEALFHADVILAGVDPIQAIIAADEVWTISSLAGFEALLRARSVTCLGTPFYAGWGLTRDLGASVARRKARVSLDALVYCTLIQYPRYLDPVSGLACPVEVVAERLVSGDGLARGPANRVLSKCQGMLASFAPLWR